MKAGALDFMEKPLDGDAALERQGRFTRSREALQAVSERGAVWSSTGAAQRRASIRFWLIVRGGLTNRQMAAELGITEKTIKVHRGQVTRKMKAGSVADLVRMTQRLKQSA
jgi:FixJ family two-component response regulator